MFRETDDNYHLKINVTSCTTMIMNTVVFDITIIVFTQQLHNTPSHGVTPKQGVTVHKVH